MPDLVVGGKDLHWTGYGNGGGVSFGVFTTESS
jgi:hypothetical protein